MPLTRLALPLALVALLAACGADGPPVAPAAAQPAQPGVSLSGAVKVGIGGNL